MSDASSRRALRAALALVFAGIVSLIIGLVRLDADVEGSYFDQSVVTIHGKGWLVAGTVLVGLGASALAASVLRDRAAR